MSKTTLSALSGLGLKEKLLANVSFFLLIQTFNVVQACAQWPSPWPDSSNLPAGATQSGNVFPGGNLWGGNKLYTPASLPQRYMSWNLGPPWDGLPAIHGALDPGLATYRGANGSRIIGYDMYNLEGIPIGQSNSLPINASDSRWNPYRNGSTGSGEFYAEDVSGCADGALMIPAGNMFVFHISHPANTTPAAPTQAWFSFNFLGNVFDMETVDDSAPLVTAVFGPGSVLDGWYQDPATTTALKWGCDGFAVTFTNHSDSATFGIANISGNDVWVDNIQIATVCIPESGTWRLLTLGGLGFITWRWLRDNEERRLALQRQRCAGVEKHFRMH